jgi:hypothetical protein
MAERFDFGFGIADCGFKKNDQGQAVYLSIRLPQSFF